MTEEAAFHQLLGELKKGMESSDNQRKLLFEKVDVIGTQQTTLIAEFRNHMDKENALEESHGKLSERVIVLEGFRNKLVGMWAILSGFTISQIEAVQNIFKGQS